MMRRALTLALTAAVLGAPAALEAANPWEELMGRKQRTWSDPEGRFTIDLPVGWTAKPQQGAPVVDFWKRHPDLGAVAHVAVRMKTVPPGVKARHFALHVNRETKAHAPGYQVLEEARAEVSGVPAIRTYFRYRERGNAQLTNEVEQYVLVTGERAFVITFEHAAGARSIFTEDFGYMVKGFAARSGPAAPTRAGPKKRRRIRAGEMINPDAVRY